MPRHSPESWIDQLATETVVVHIRGGSSVKGLLRAAYADALIVTHATLLDPDGNAEIPGEIVIPRAGIDFIQHLPPDHS